MGEYFKIKYQLFWFALIFCSVNCDLWGAVSWAVPLPGCPLAQRQKYSALLAPIYMWTRMFPGQEIRGWDVPCRLLGSEGRRRALAPIPSDFLCLPCWAEPAGWTQALSSCLFAYVGNFCNYLPAPRNFCVRFSVWGPTVAAVLCVYVHFNS